MADKKAKQDEKVTVTVIAENHRHGGKPVKKGSLIEVFKNQLQWLVNNKIIEG